MGGNFNTHGMDFLFPATELVYLSKFDTNPKKTFDVENQVSKSV